MMEGGGMGVASVSDGGDVIVGVSLSNDLCGSLDEAAVFTIGLQSDREHRGEEGRCELM